MKKIITIVVICCCNLVVNSQTVLHGRVIDKQTKEPLEQAYVCWNNSNNAKGITTNKQGYFSLTAAPASLADTGTLVVSFIGYNTRRCKANNNADGLVVEMEKGAVNLQEVVITPQSAAASFHTISKIDLNLQPARSAQDVLRTVPGLFIGQHQGGGKAEQLFLRGFDIDHGTDINISADGIPVNMVSHAHGQGYADLHFIIPELISNIDYGKGPYYTQYGNLATAGYVSLNTVNTLDKSTVKTEGGQFNTIRGLAMVNLLSRRQQQQGTSAYIAAEGLYSDGPFVSPQHFNRANLFAKFNTLIGTNNKLHIIASTFNSDWDASGQIPERAVKSGLINRFGAIDNTEGGYTSRTNASVSLTTYVNEHTTWENQVFYSHYNFSLHSNFTFFLNDPVNGDQIRQRESRNTIGYSSRFSHAFNTGPWHVQSSYGAGVRNDATHNSELSHTINRNTVLKYIQLGNITETNGFTYIDETIEKDRWQINLGSRLDYLYVGYTNALTADQMPNQHAFIASPKLNVQYTISNKTQLYVKTGKGFHSNDARVVVFNKGYDILPAAWGADVGVLLKPTPRLLINAAAWWLYLQQEFVYVGDEGVVEPSGKTRRIGIDISGRYQFCASLFGDVNINLARPRSLNAGKGENYIPLAPTLTSTGGLSWQLKNGIKGSIRYRYMHDRPANEYNSVTAKGYTVTDCSLNYTKQKYAVGVSIENLFNVTWNETQFYTTSQLKNESTPVSEINFTPGTPFFAKAKFSIFF
jgi:outer membrane cobalamin receptor